MSFKFIGEGGGAVPAESANSSIWVYKSANFTYWEPRASDVFAIVGSHKPKDARAGLRPCAGLYSNRLDEKHRRKPSAILRRRLRI